jgi:uncharacterized protein YraI
VKLVFLAAIATLVVVVAGVRHADADAFLRVIAQKTPVRTGPGASYREVYSAERGQVFHVVERATRDFWFKIELDDGTTGWILGDTVFPFEVRDKTKPGIFRRMGRAISRAILGPSAAMYANVGLSFSAGVLDQEGVFILRPSWLIDPYWALEGFGGLSPRAEKDIFLGGLAFVLRLAPGAGAARIRPKADNFIDKEETLFALGAGGGLEITFKKQITVRLDARNWTIFDADKSNNGQEYTGGLAIFF